MESAMRLSAEVSAEGGTWLEMGGAGGANKLLSELAPVAPAGRSTMGGGATLGPSRVFTRPMSSWGWKGLRISSSALTAMALSATVLLTTPDMRMTGTEPYSACCLICV